MTIDWTKPIEYTDGSSARVIRSKNNGDGDFVVTPHREPDRKDGNYYYRDGSPVHCTGTRLHIRNVKEEAVMETKWGAEITGGRPDGVSDDEMVINKGAVEVEACYWMSAFEPYRLRADHPYYGKAENDELTALRAFKAMALERYPDLESKPETDEDAAQRFEEDYWSDIIDQPRDLALAAISWARANPRNAGTKEG